MFCPKCGTKNPDDGKYCRSCGVDLGNVSAALDGTLAPLLSELGLDSGSAQIKNEARRRSDPSEVYGDSIKSIISGIGFLIVSVVLFATGVAGGRAWWWALLFPAFTFLGKGISDLMKSKRMERSRQGTHSAIATSTFEHPRTNPLPPAQTTFISPDESRYKTGDLVPPSVTDNTTRHLEMNSEGETMTLPKK